MSKFLGKASSPIWGRCFPAVDWLKTYTWQDFNADFFAGIITAILLIPQGIAYAMLAGLPPQLGLYASIFPPVIYALLGTSKTLSVGPVSIAAIMVASALTTPEIMALGDPVESAIILAAEGGIILLLMALLRMGGLVNFISHPVLTGFTSGASILIIVSQLPQLLGVTKPHCGLQWPCYQDLMLNTNSASLALGLFCIFLLVFFGAPLTWLLKRIRLSISTITYISRCGPLLAVILTTMAVTSIGYFSRSGVTVVGEIPEGLPQFSLDFISSEKWRLLLPYAAFIALIAYIESYAIARVTANASSQRVDPNQELIALGATNIASAVSGGMSVAGGFSRTMVNHTAGARTQMAMLIAAMIVAVAMISFTEGFANIPKATLAGVILVAIFPLVRFKSIINTWRYDHGDGTAELVTLVGVLILGIEEGLALGIVLTIASYLRKVSHPHIAVVGRIPDTEHFRNINRHQVETWKDLLLLRIDENITYANFNYIEDYLNAELDKQASAKNLVLILASVSHIDSTALEALEQLNLSLQGRGIRLHLAEVKGPVLDKLKQTEFLELLHPGKVYLRTEDAVEELGG
jgi:SulP family sulfate permease